MTCRKNWARMTVGERQGWIAAILTLKNSPSWPSVLHPTDPNRHRYDDYVELHLGAMSMLPSWGHNAPAFFSWHRELLRHFELDLQVINPAVSIPYWDWQTNQGTGLPIWDADATSGLGTNGRASDLRVMDGAFAFGSGQWTIRVKDASTDPDYLRRRFTDGGAETLATISADQTQALGRTAYDSSPWWDLDSMGNFVRPAGAFGVLRVETEYDLHNLVHRWVSGTMGQAVSPNDPIFWLHHCNLDRLWSVWQRQHPTSAPYLPTPPTTGVPTGHRSDQALVFTDAAFPTAPWPGSTTSASLTNHHAISPGGYWYDTDPPEVIARTNSIDFHDVPQGVGGAGVTTYRAIVLEAVPGPCNAVRLEITGGPTAGFATPLGLSDEIPSSDSAASKKARVWLSYNSSSGTIVGGSVTVTASSRDSGGTVVWTDSWTVNLSANSIPRPKSAIALVLDRSGSMSEDAGDGQPKIAKLREALGVFLEVMLEGDGLAIVRFDHEVNRLMGVTDVGPAPAVPGSGRAQAAAIVASHNPADTLDPRGMTSIGGGVAEGKLALDTAPPVVPPWAVRAMLVLTDGNENFPPMIDAVEATGITANTFAIGFGTAANVSGPTLNRLTQNHNGYMIVTGTISPSERFRLSKYFLQILAGLNNQQIVVDPQGALVFGTTHRIPFSLTEADYGADIILLTPGPKYLDLRLETPDGRVITPAVAGLEPAVSFVAGQDVCYYRLGLPALAGGSPSGSHGGRWHALLTLGPAAREVSREFVAKQSGRALPYSLLVHSWSSLQFGTSLQQSSFEPGATALLHARLTEYDVPVEKRARVWATVIRPDGSTLDVALDETQPGTFEGKFAAPFAGVYTARVQAMGATFYGTPFRREQTLTGIVFAGGDRRTDPGVADLIDRLRERDERLCQLLLCLLDDRIIDQELAKKLKASGLHVDGIRECLKKYCVSMQKEHREIVSEQELKGAGAAKTKAASRQHPAEPLPEGFAEIVPAKPIEETRRVPMPKGMPLFPSREQLERMRPGHGGHKHGAAETRPANRKLRKGGGGSTGSKPRHKRPAKKQ